MKNVEELAEIKSFATSVRLQCQRQYAKVMNGMEIPEDFPSHLVTLYLNTQMKLLDLHHAAEMLDSAMRNHIQHLMKEDEQ